MGSAQGQPPGAESAAVGLRHGLHLGVPYCSHCDRAVTEGLAQGAPDAHAVRSWWHRQPWTIVDVPEVTLAAYTPPVILGPGGTEVLALAQSLTDPLLAR